MPHAPSGPVPIRDLALLGDRRTAALVARDGAVVWYCPGRFDAPPLLDALLDAGKGRAWTPEADGLAPVARRYVGHGGVLETRLAAEGAELVLTDFLPYGEGLPRGLARLLSPAPADLTLRLGAVPGSGRLHASHPVREEDGALVVRVPRGESAWLFLADDAGPPPEAGAVEHWRDATIAAWHRLARPDPYRGPHEAAVSASVRALRLLTHEAGGGLIAAPTTSLPEVPGGDRNWDYRYVWLRDAAMIVSALTRAGGDGAEARAFLAFACRASDADAELPLLPVLTVDGEPVPEERELDLAGYGGARPVRVGNGARAQVQLDAYGNVLLAAKLIYERFGTREHWGVVSRLADFLAERWREDDSGIWEERTRRPSVTGKVLAACALEYLAPHADDPARRERWTAAARDLRAWVAERGLTSEGAFAYVAGRDEVDVTAALYPVWGYCAPDAPEMLATMRALDRDARVGALYRRALLDTDPRAEGAFLAGTFWVAHYWTMRDPARAREILDAAIACANDLGLLAEEALPDGTALGNFPQSFVHAALVGAVLDYREAVEGR